MLARCSPARFIAIQVYLQGIWSRKRYNLKICWISTHLPASSTLASRKCRYLKFVELCRSSDWNNCPFFNHSTFGGGLPNTLIFKIRERICACLDILGITNFTANRGSSACYHLHFFGLHKHSWRSWSRNNKIEILELERIGSSNYPDSFFFWETMQGCNFCMRKWRRITETIFRFRDIAFLRTIHKFSAPSLQRGRFTDLLRILFLKNKEHSIRITLVFVQLLVFSLFFQCNLARFRDSTHCTEHLARIQWNEIWRNKKKTFNW